MTPAEIRDLCRRKCHTHISPRQRTLNPETRNFEIKEI